MSAILDNLVYKSESAPSLPKTYNRIAETVENPESSFEDIARIVESDSHLSNRILRLANSSFYSYPSTVSSVADALTVIGLQQFKNMVLSTCVMDVFKNVPVTSFSMNDFWRRSIACGLCARIMALELREANSERYFLGGLLHKIGRLVILEREPEKSGEIIARSKKVSKQLQAIEQDVLGIDHCVVGGALLELWNLPKSLVELVRYYNKPILATLSVQEVSIIHIADFISESLQLGTAGDRFVPEFSEAAWDYSGLNEGQIYYIVEELKRQYEDVCSVFLDSNVDL